MKKRYARILAATLSAAMVFTSAPASVFDTGVIEAQAETVAWTQANLEEALADIATASAVTTPATKTYTGSLKVADIAGASQSAAGTVCEAIKNTVSTPDTCSHGLTVAPKAGDAYEAVKNTTAAGSYPVTFTVKCATCDGSPSADVTVAININKKTINIADSGDLGETGYTVAATDAWLPAPTAGQSYVYGMASLTTTATSGTASVGNNIPNVGYNMSDDDWNAVRALGFGDKVKVTIKAENSTLPVVNYTAEGVEGVEIKDGKVVVSKEITVHKAARTKADAQATLDDYDTVTESAQPLNQTAVTASYEKGASSVTLGGPAKDLVEIDRVLVALNESTTSQANAVRIRTKKSYNAKEYGGNESNGSDALTNGATVSEGSLTWTYNSADGYFYTTIALTVGNKKIAQKDIVWPTALAAGQTLTSGDPLNKVKLAETESSKYGTFTIAKAGNASAKDTVYAVKFTPNAGVEVDMSGDNNDLNVSSENVKAAQLKVSVAKKNIAASDLNLSLSRTDSTVDYGTTYSAVDATIIGKNDTFCEYAVKGVKSTDMASTTVPMGEQTITYTVKVKDVDETSIDGAVSVEKTVKVTVKKPDAKATVVMNNALATYSTISNVTNPVAPNANVVLSALFGYKTTAPEHGFKINASTPTELTVETAKLGDLNVFNSTSTLTYQWYKNGTELYNQKAAYLEVDTSKLGTDEYYCEITLKLPSTATDVEKAAWEALVPGGKITTAKQKVNVTNSNIGTVSVVGNKTYGSIDATASVFVNPAKDYKVSSVEWYVNDKDDKKVCDIPAADTTLVDGYATAKIPTTLDAATGGDAYKLCVKVTATAEGKETDIAVKEAQLEIARKTLELKLVKPSFATGQGKLVYGQMNSELEYTVPTGSEEFGTYEIVDPRTIQTAGTNKTITIRFIPNAKTLKNYTVTGSTDAWGEDFVANKKSDFAMATVTITPADLTVKADDITIEVGGTVPTVGTYTVEGLCVDDTELKIGLEVTVKVDAAKVDTTKAGSYEAITVEAKINNASGNYEPTAITVPGKVIVKEKAAATVAPSTAPTTAPTAAPVKAAKATVSVKAGKTVTLKLKNAPKGAKVTWSLDKKAKKALKVSKKGKVTVKKGAKKGTYKVYAKVNGKKVTFKVKVK